jgi:hypothetical protein
VPPKRACSRRAVHDVPPRRGGALRDHAQPSSRTSSGSANALVFGFALTSCCSSPATPALPPAAARAEAVSAAAAASVLLLTTAPAPAATCRCRASRTA